jgi:hypothetical protein
MIMGFIREPEGVDFVIQGKPLTEKQKKELSAFIKADKEKNQREKRKTKSVVKTKKIFSV